MPDVQAQIARGLAARADGQLDVALANLQAAYEALPGHWVTQINYATALQDVGRLDKAITLFARAAKSGETVALTNLGMAWLRAGNDTQGFLAFLARWRTAGWPQAPYRIPCPHVFPDIQTLPNLELLETSGMVLPTGKLVVMPDQGYGDTLMTLPFVRSLLRARPDAVVMVKKPVLTVAQAALGDLTDQVFSSANGRFDAWLTGFDIPAFLPESLRDYGSERQIIETRLRGMFGGVVPEMAADVARIGVVWRGNPGHTLDCWRSVGSEVLGDMLRGLPCQPVCLLPDATEQECELFAKAAGLALDRPALADFTDTARLLLSCTALVSVDTAVAHLAGLLGTDCRLLVNAFGDWRWRHEGENVAWYPSVRACRQKRLGEWFAVAGAVRRGIECLLENRDGLLHQHQS